MERIQQKSNRVDKFDFAQIILHAKTCNTIKDEDYDLLVEIYEKAIEKDVNNNQYSPTMKLTPSQKKMLNVAI